MTKHNGKNLYCLKQRIATSKIVVFSFPKSLDFAEVVWYCVVLPEVIRMNVIKELWHGNIVPQEDSRTNTKDMKELLGYIARHHEDLDKTFTAEQKELYEKLHDCWDEYVSLAEEAIFEYAFKLGAHMILDIQNIK